MAELNPLSAAAPAPALARTVFAFALALSAFRKLSPDKQKLIMRAFIDETKRSQLAAQYNVPTGTMKTNIRRTVLGLRKSVQDEIDRESARAGRRAA